MALDLPEDLLRLQAQARKRLAEFGEERKSAGIGPNNKIDILWGWKQISGALGVSEGTARRLYKEHGLPLFFRKGPQTTRSLLQAWAEGTENNHTNKKEV